MGGGKVGIVVGCWVVWAPWKFPLEEQGSGVLWSRWSKEEMEEVYKEGVGGGLDLCETLQVTVSVSLSCLCDWLSLWVGQRVIC